MDAPKRFYRVLYVREDLNLFELGVTILSAFDCHFCHMFMLFDKKYTYVDKLWKDEFSNNFGIDDEFTRDRDYEKYKLSDLELRANNTFKLCYDTGDNWEFEIKIYKAEKDLNEEVFGKLIEGAGASKLAYNTQNILTREECIK